MDNKHTIIHCAIKLFADHGYDGVSVQQITEAAGITKPTLYYYFGSKKGLLEEAVASRFAQMKSKIFQDLPSNGDMPLILFKIIRAYFSCAQADPDFCRMKLSVMYSFTESEAYEVMLPIFAEETSILEDLFVNAALYHGNMKGRHKEYAASFLGIVTAYIRLSYVHAMDLSDDLAFKVVHQFMHGIFS